MSRIDVACQIAGEGWRCQVTVSDDRRRVRLRCRGASGRPVPALAPARPGFRDIDRLVHETFAFLLEREPRSSILARFDLPVVERYFPEYPAEMRRRLSVLRRTAWRVSSRPMCEHFIARAAEPFRLDELWPFTEKLERFGIAGFGWGAAWTGDDGRLASYRDVRAFRDDPGREAVGRTETTSALVHLRRPSRLSTLTLPDTQPFDDPAGRFAFSHNGDLRDYKGLRADVPGAGPDPRPRRHGGRCPLARGRLAPR